MELGGLGYLTHYDLSIGAILNDLQRPTNPHFKVTPMFDVFVVRTAIYSYQQETDQ